METQENPQPTPVQPVYKESRPSIGTPVAIIVAGFLIALGIFFSNGGLKTSPKVIVPKLTKSAVVTPVSDKDHVRGSLNADMVFVEFSDLECPACKIFHPTMHQILEEYGKDQKVAWVYRSFPLMNIHPRAFKEAVAAECMAELAGEAYFWKFIDRVFEITPSNNQLDPARLPLIAQDVAKDQTGFTPTKFSSCLSSKKYDEKINTNIKDGVAAGLTGTPYTIVILKKPISEKVQKNILQALQDAIDQIAPGEKLSSTLISFDPSGTQIVLKAGFPYEMMKALIDATLDLD